MASFQLEIANSTLHQRVIFLISDNNRRELGDVFTDYWKLRDKKGETELSQKLRMESEELHHGYKKYEEALIKMKEAYEELSKKF